MYRICAFLLIFIVFLSCNRNKNINSNETVVENDNIVHENINQIIVYNDIALLEENIDISLFPKIMYVTARDGLRIRSEPSTNGEVNGILQYGQRIVIHEKSESIDTINGISNYWYRLLLDRRRNDWIFGEYISENLPYDLPIIMGKWDNINSEIRFDYFIEAISFLPNNEFIHTFRKESSNGIWGSYNLKDNIITIFDLRPGMDYMAANYGLSDEDDWSVVLENNRLPSQSIKLTIIDNNNIILEFTERIIELRRSEDLW